jgi:hypothetical protein
MPVISFETEGFAMAIPATALVTETAGVKIPSAIVRAVPNRHWRVVRQPPSSMPNFLPRQREANAVWETLLTDWHGWPQAACARHWTASPSRWSAPTDSLLPSNSSRAGKDLGRERKFLPRLIDSQQFILYEGWAVSSPSEVPKYRQMKT